MLDKFAMHSRSVVQKTGIFEKIATLERFAVLDCAEFKSVQYEFRNRSVVTLGADGWSKN